MIKWISSEGGPLILVPMSELSSWHGCCKNGEHCPNGGKTDYERACEVSEYVNVIDVGRATGLVLGEHLQTCWMLIDQPRGGVLAQWIYADNEAHVLRQLRSISMDLFHSAKLEYCVTEPLVLFDSAVAGIDIMPNESLRIELTPGTYAVASVEYEPDNRTKLVVHRLARAK